MHFSELNNSDILVTGASGFIGSALSTELVKLGARVHGVSRSSKEFNENVQWHQGDLTDLSYVDQLIESVRPDYVFHLAGHVVGRRDVQQVIPSLKNNLLTTVNLLVSLDKYKCKRMVLAGSLEEPVFGDKVLEASSPYAVSKFAASNYSKMFHQLYQFPVTIAKIFMVYGPGVRDLKKLLPYVILTAANGNVPELTSGTRKLDWIYIDDIVSGLIHLAIAPGIDGQTIDIGTGKLTSTRDIVELTVKLMNPDIKSHFGAVEDRVMEQERRANSQETFDKISWKAKIDLESGLKKLINSLV